jgi:histidinol-phosphate phosphatase family protein
VISEALEAVADAEGAAVFLDRDGTVIDDQGYPGDWRQVRLLPGAGAGLARLKREGFILVLVSNQSGIGRGLISTEAARQVHERLLALLEECGVRLDGAFYCPHAPEAGCGCRKPAPGMLCAAAEKLRLRLDRCFLVGDKESDLETAHNAGCRALFLEAAGKDGNSRPLAAAVVPGWPEVVDYILRAGDH